MNQNETFLLLFSISIDIFVAGLSIGMNRISISKTSSLLLALISTVFLIISCQIGNIILSCLPLTVINLISFSIFFLFGINKIIESIQIWLQKKKEIRIKISNLEIIYRVYKNPIKANKIDLDSSKTLSIKETLLLSVALSLDNLLIGLSLGLTKYPFYFTIITSFSIGLGMLYLGNKAGNIFSQKSNLNVSWISGIILIILGFCR